MIEIGRLCVKIAGRDAGKKCVVVDIVNDTYVLIDGETRRRKCNIMHLEPLDQKIEIKKGASHGEVSSILKELGIETRHTKPKQKTERPLKQRKAKVKPAEVVKEKKPKKKEAVKEAVKPKKETKKKEEKK
jgi:large subunit ribosomal protein L14e